MIRNFAIKFFIKLRRRIHNHIRRGRRCFCLVSHCGGGGGSGGGGGGGGGSGGSGGGGGGV